MAVPAEQFVVAVQWATTYCPRMEMQLLTLKNTTETWNLKRQSPADRVCPQGVRHVTLDCRDGRIGGLDNGSKHVCTETGQFSSIERNRSVSV